MLSLLSDEYGATGQRDGDWWTVTIRPIDQFRRGTIIYLTLAVDSGFSYLSVSPYADT